MQKQPAFLSHVQRSWHWALFMGWAASIFSLMFGLLFQTVFYEIARNIPSIYRQDTHISIPLCNTFPNLYGCDAWEGAMTGLEISELSIQIGQTTGLVINLVLIAIFSAWLTVRVQCDNIVLGLITGVNGGFSSFLIAKIVDVPVTTYSYIGIFGILMISLLPLSGLAGGQLGVKRFARKTVFQSVRFVPTNDTEQLDRVGESLSRRELEVLALVASGFKNNEIAKRLFISKATVKTHLQHIFRKLGVKNRTVAVTQALACGWINQVEVESD